MKDLDKPLRILFALPGLHKVNRGAEAAFENVARELTCMGEQVTLIGSGPTREISPYSYIHAPARPRESFAGWPTIAPLRDPYRWEELCFTPGLWKAYQPRDFDVTLTCSYPFVNWLLRLKKDAGRRPAHVFVTENGDWPALRLNSEYRFFSCDGLICTNPEYYQRHHKTWPAALIPNGVDISSFTPDGPNLRKQLAIPDDKKVVLMVSALIESKHVLEGVRAVASIPDIFMLVAGDGPLAKECDQLGESLLKGRYKRATFKSLDMPSVYRSADMLMHLSREEAFGNIYIEAASCGLSVAAHDYSTPRWILGEMGFFADTRNAAALRELILHTLSSVRTLDRQAAHLNISKRFSWKVVAESYLQFLRTLLYDKAALTSE